MAKLRPTATGAALVLSHRFSQCAAACSTKQHARVAVEVTLDLGRPGSGDGPRKSAGWLGLFGVEFGGGLSRHRRLTQKAGERLIRLQRRGDFVIQLYLRQDTDHRNIARS